VRGRVYDFDYGSGYLVEGRSGVSVVRQDFVLPSLNTDLAKRLRPRQKLAFKLQPAPLHPQVRLMPARPPISTNGHRPGENGRPALEKLAICESVYPFFIPGAAYGYTVPPKSTNAHQVGKNDRAGAKKFRLGKIYILELTALPVAPSNQIGVGHYGVVGQVAGWRG
jgi:hypothetical protein